MHAPNVSKGLEHAAAFDVVAYLPERVQDALPSLHLWSAHNLSSSSGSTEHRGRHERQRGVQRKVLGLERA